MKMVMAVMVAMNMKTMGDGLRGLASKTINGRARRARGAGVSEDLVCKNGAKPIVRESKKCRAGCDTIAPLAAPFA